MDLGALVQQLGFPVAIAIYFIWQNGRTEKEHKDDLRNVAQQSVKSLDASTEAIKDQTAVNVKNTTALDNNTAILNKVSGALTARGAQNGNGGN